MYILKQYFFLEVITRGRSNQVSDRVHPWAWQAGGQGLELMMDCYWLGGTWRYSCSRSALIFCKSSSGEQAQCEHRSRGRCQVIVSNIRKVGFFLFPRFFFFAALTFPESKTYIWLDISLAHTPVSTFSSVCCPGIKFCSGWHLRMRS